MTRKKQAKLRKINKLRNKRLVKKYPWLKPKFHPWTGRKLKRYDFEWTWRDDIPRGWNIAFGDMMLGEIDSALRKAGLLESFTIEQIKEKYGALELYNRGGNREIDSIISDYTHISEYVCIHCGRPDVKMTNTGWIIPLCKDCYERNVNSTRSYEEVTDSKDDGRIPDVRKYRQFRPDGPPIDVEVDISERVNRVRMRYEKRMRKRMKTVN